MYNAMGLSPSIAGKKKRWNNTVVDHRIILRIESEIIFSEFQTLLK
jgi:hypothetical protein